MILENLLARGSLPKLPHSDKDQKSTFPIDTILDLLISVAHISSLLILVAPQTPFTVNTDPSCVSLPMVYSLLFMAPLAASGTIETPLLSGSDFIRDGRQ